MAGRAGTIGARHGPEARPGQCAATRCGSALGSARLYIVPPPQLPPQIASVGDGEGWRPQLPALDEADGEGQVALDLAEVKYVHVYCPGAMFTPVVHYLGTALRHGPAQRRGPALARTSALLPGRA